MRKHLIFYHATESELRVVRVIYSARDIAGIFKPDEKEQDNR